MNAYYNDIDAYCASVLRTHIEDGALHAGFIDGPDSSMAEISLASETPTSPASDAGHAPNKSFIGCESRNGRILGRWSDADRNDSQGIAWWDAEPAVGRVAHGVPARVDRLKGLGNAIVPHHALWIGRAILEHMQYRRTECRS